MLLDYVAGLCKDNAKKIVGNENIVYINQSIFFSDRLSGEDFLNFVYRLDDERKQKKQYYAFIKQFGSEKEICNILKKQWGMLSWGERKYIYLSILLSLDREWYILDEPFAFIDTNKKNTIWKIIDKKISEGKGIILTSHENSDIRRYDVNIVDL